MTSFTTPGILLRRIAYGDHDLILSLFTLHEGKVSVIAKSAKKSAKRFSGILEPFSVLQLVWSTGRGKGLPVLKEASLQKPFFRIRANVKKTAYASYWAELINEWMEEGVRHDDLYYLFEHVLAELDRGGAEEGALSILFQMRFMSMSGFCPDLTQCGICRINLEKIEENRVVFDFAKGGLLCSRCASGATRKASLSKGTIKQLRWIETGRLEKAKRIRFAGRELKEALDVMERFVPYHLGKKPKSLIFLGQIRNEGKL
jgi:DNA repair protein RecO (recombination protein O)